MPSPDRPPRSRYRRLWLPELIVVLSLMVVTTIVFAATDLDLATARSYYEPDHPRGQWPYSKRWIWRLFYRAAPYVTGLLAAPAVALVIVGSFRRKPRHLRLYGACILLAGFLGPGLVINAIFKDFWGHPRPRQIEEFGGRNTYVLKPLPGRIGRGMSFPCGHCSVGFLYSVFWFIFRRRRPWIAGASLALGTALGTLLGVARVAAGGHFLSDVIWAALLTHLISLCVYYFWLNVPGREDAPEAAAAEESPRRRAAIVAGMGGVSVVIVIILLYAHPDSKDIRFGVAAAEIPPGEWVADLGFDKADVTITLSADDDPAAYLDGYVRAFGMPTNRIDDEKEIVPGTPHLFRYRLTEVGLYADLEAAVTVRLGTARLSRLVVRVGEGDVIVKKATGAAMPDLDVRSADGEVTLPGPARRP